MPRKNKAEARMEEVRDKFLQRAAELWDKHQAEFSTVLENAESHCLNITFTAALDFSESAAKLETKQSFSEVHRDSTEDTFDDPSQPALGQIAAEAAAAGPAPKKRGRSRKAAAASDDRDETGGEA
jgi:hypothetical protein